jgi:hypothetical protein
MYGSPGEKFFEGPYGIRPFFLDVLDHIWKELILGGLPTDR